MTKTKIKSKGYGFTSEDIQIIIQEMKDNKRPYWDSLGRKFF